VAKGIGVDSMTLGKPITQEQYLIEEAREAELVKEFEEWSEDDFSDSETTEAPPVREFAWDEYKTPISLLAMASENYQIEVDGDTKTVRVVR
jgi:hypothetical protein